jgi:hypothetical protein
MGDIWDRWQRYQEIAELELVTHDLDILIQEANQLTNEAREISAKFEIEKPKEAKQ